MQTPKLNISNLTLHVGMTFLQKCFDKGTEFGLTRREILCLSRINSTPGSTQASLAEALSIDIPSMSRLIDDLVAKQYVDKEVNKDNRRKLSIKLTDKGEEIVARMFEMAEEIGEVFFKELTIEEKEIYFNLLNKIMKGEKNV